MEGGIPSRDDKAIDLNDPYDKELNLSELHLESGYSEWKREEIFGRKEEGLVYLELSWLDINRGKLAEEEAKKVEQNLILRDGFKIICRRIWVFQ